MVNRNMRWTLETLHKPAFELLDAAQFFCTPVMGDGLPDQTVKNWTVRGFLRPVMGKRGKKDVRRYTAADLLRIFIASHLVWQHTSLTAAFLAAECGVERIEHFIRSGEFPVSPDQEHWVSFEDHGESTTRYTGNDRTNFWVQRSFSSNGIVHAPLMPRVEWGLTQPPAKTEVINLDLYLKCFLAAFCTRDVASDLSAKVLPSWDKTASEPVTLFEKFISDLEARVRRETSAS